MKTMDIGELRELLSYEPETGKLFWRRRAANHFPTEARSRQWNTLYADKEAFTAISNAGYRHGDIKRVQFLAHRVIFAMHYGEWPASIDHINGDRCDNRVINLRAASRADNQKNLKMNRRNTSGTMGVYWYKRGQKWKAQIQVDGRVRPLGTFSTKEEAIAARKLAEASFGFHENHGRKASKLKVAA